MVTLKIHFCSFLRSTQNVALCSSVIKIFTGFWRSFYFPYFHAVLKIWQKPSGVFIYKLVWYFSQTRSCCGKMKFALKSKQFYSQILNSSPHSWQRHLLLRTSIPLCKFINLCSIMLNN
jgi:hypothetical protein